MWLLLPTWFVLDTCKQCDSITKLLYFSSDYCHGKFLWLNAWAKDSPCVLFLLNYSQYIFINIYVFGYLYSRVDMLLQVVCIFKRDHIVPLNYCNCGEYGKIMWNTICSTDVLEITTFGISGKLSLEITFLWQQNGQWNWVLSAVCLTHCLFMNSWIFQLA